MGGEETEEASPIPVIQIRYLKRIDCLSSMQSANYNEIFHHKEAAISQAI